MPDHKARIAPLAAVFGVNGAMYGSLLPRYPRIADQVEASTGQFGLALAGIGVGGVAGAFIATFVVRALTSPSVAASGPLVAVAGILVGRLALDRAVDAVGWRAVVRVAGGLTVIGTVAAVGLGSSTRESAPVLVGLGVAAVGAGVAAPLLFDRAGYLAARVGLSPDAGPGLVSGVFRLGVLVSPLLVGGVAELTNLFLALGVTAVAGAALVIFATPLARDGE